jgi:hypothetical protein
MQWVTLAKELVLRGSSDVVGICKVGKKISCCHSEASERLASPLLEAY